MQLARFILLCLVGGGWAQGEQEYCEISAQHTLCLYGGVGPACGQQIDRGLQDKEIAQVLDYHNRLRSRVAVGSTNQPPASNMLELQWDPELARIAQRLADQCKFQHDCSDCRSVKRFRVGQNIYQSFNTRSDRADWTAAMDSWFNEIKIFPVESVNNYQFAAATGHYSQMVWAKTDRLGCGVTAFRSGRFISRLYVCNYGEAGNIIRQQVYKIGKSCSSCPAGCSADYPGLCTTQQDSSNSGSGISGISGSSSSSSSGGNSNSCEGLMCMIQMPVTAAGNVAMDTAHTVGGTAMHVGHVAMGTVESISNLVTTGGQTIVNTGFRPVNNLVFNGFSFATRPFFAPIRFPQTFFSGRK